ncbi:Zn finger protein [Polyrhizophydium stewartii]|uniref:Zn finger protein n=1 Tax=Polyrhizophydium stewartii TaxID=2732419 RepID=A0ABR4MVV7_9FUNG
MMGSGDAGEMHATASQSAPAKTAPAPVNGRPAAAGASVASHADADPPASVVAANAAVPVEASDLVRELETTHKRNRVLEQLVEALRAKLRDAESQAARPSAPGAASSAAHTGAAQAQPAATPLSAGAPGAKAPAPAAHASRAAEAPSATGAEAGPAALGSSAQVSPSKKSKKQRQRAKSTEALRASDGTTATHKAESAVVAAAAARAAEEQQLARALFEQRLTLAHAETKAARDELAKMAIARYESESSSEMILLVSQEAVRLRLENDALKALLAESETLSTAQAAEIARLGELHARALEEASADAKQKHEFGSTAPSSDTYLHAISRGKALEQLLQTTTTQCAALQKEIERKDEMIRQHQMVIAEREGTIHAQVVELQKCQVMLSEANQVVASMRSEFAAVQDQVARAIAIGKSRDAALEERNEIIQKMEARIQYSYTHSLDVFLKKALFAGSDIHRLNREHWVQDRDARKCHLETCNVVFGTLNRRHHCRRCGNIFCSAHASHRMKLSLATLGYHPDGVETKVCDACSTEAHERASLDMTDFESLLAGRVTVPMKTVDRACNAWLERRLEFDVLARQMPRSRSFRLEARRLAAQAQALAQAQSLAQAGQHGQHGGRGEAGVTQLIEQSRAEHRQALRASGARPLLLAAHAEQPASAVLDAFLAQAASVAEGEAALRSRMLGLRFAGPPPPPSWNWMSTRALPMRLMRRAEQQQRAQAEHEMRQAERQRVLERRLNGGDAAADAAAAAGGVVHELHGALRSPPPLVELAARCIGRSLHSLVRNPAHRSFVEALPPHLKEPVMAAAERIDDRTVALFLDPGMTACSLVDSRISVKTLAKMLPVGPAAVTVATAAAAAASATSAGPAFRAAAAAHDDDEAAGLFGTSAGGHGARFIDVLEDAEMDTSADGSVVGTDSVDGDGVVEDWEALDEAAGDADGGGDAAILAWALAEAVAKAPARPRQPTRRTSHVGSPNVRGEPAAPPLLPLAAPIFRGYRHLDRLDISFSEHLPAGTVSALLVSAAPLLRHLDVSGCFTALEGPQFLDRVAARLGYLETLSMRFCLWLRTDTVLGVDWRVCLPRLDVLDVASCPLVNGPTVSRGLVQAGRQGITVCM